MRSKLALAAVIVSLFAYRASATGIQSGGTSSGGSSSGGSATTSTAAFIMVGVGDSTSGAVTTLQVSSGNGLSVNFQGSTATLVPNLSVLAGKGFVATNQSTTSATLGTFGASLSTGDRVDDGTTASTTSIGTRILNGAVSLWDNGSFKGNVNTIALLSNLSASVSGATGTISASGSGGIDYGNLPKSGATNYIQNTSNLVMGTTIYASSGTFLDLNVSSSFRVIGVSTFSGTIFISSSAGSWVTLQNIMFGNTCAQGDIVTADIGTNKMLCSTPLTQVVTRTSTPTVSTPFTLEAGATATFYARTTVLNDFAFITTVPVSSMFPQAVFNSSNTAEIWFSSNGLNGLGFLDHNTSTPGANGVIFLLKIPDNFVYGSTPTLSFISSIVTGTVNMQESLVLSFATMSTLGLSVSTGALGDTTLNYSRLNFTSSTVVIVIGTTTQNGGARDLKLNPGDNPLRGVTNMLLNGNCVLAVRCVRDGNSPNDPSNVRSAPYALEIKIKVQQ